MKVENILIKRRLANKKIEENIKLFKNASIALVNLANAMKKFIKIQYPIGGISSLTNDPRININKSEHIFNKNENDKSTSRN